MKFKQITCGIVTIFVIAPLLSWLLGISYGRYVGEGFAAIGVMVILFPVLFIISTNITVNWGFQKNIKNKTTTRTI